MNWRTLLSVFVGLMLSGGMAKAVEEHQLSRTQLVLNMDREFTPVKVMLEIPMLAWGEMALEEFEKRFNEDADQVLVRFLKTIRSGEGELLSLVEQGQRFQISNEAAFREGAKKRFFAEGSDLRITGVISLAQGRAYVLEVWRGDARQRAVVLPVVTNEDSGSLMVRMVSEMPLLDLLQESLQSPLAGGEVRKNETESLALSDNPWDHVRPRSTKPGDDPEFAAALKTLISKLERSRFSEAMMPATRSYLAIGLAGANRKERHRKIAEWVAPLKAADRVLHFDPVYVLLSKDDRVAPVILYKDEDFGLRWVNAGVNNAFYQLLLTMQVYPPQAPAPRAFRK